MSKVIYSWLLIQAKHVKLKGRLFYILWEINEGQFPDPGIKLDCIRHLSMTIVLHIDLKIGRCNSAFQGVVQNFRQSGHPYNPTPIQNHNLDEFCHRNL